MSEDRCVCCGEVIPEGRMVCPICLAKLKDAPTTLRTMTPEERKKGKWYLRDTTRYGRLPYVCTVCGREAIYVYDFCPNCGADMRGENL